MRNELSYVIVGLSLIATLCTSCTESGSHYAKGNAKYACDESFRPIVEEQRELFMARYPEADLDTIYTDETDAIKKLMNGDVYLVITSVSTWKQRELILVPSNLPTTGLP